MKKCPKCGAELPDEALFCNECGEKLPSSADDKTASEPSATASETFAATTSGTPAASETATASEASASAAKPASDTAASSTASAGTASSYTAPIDNSVLEKARTESKNNNIGIIAVAAVAVLLVVLIVVLIFSLAGGGYKAPLKNLTGNFNKGNTNVEDYLSCVAPGFAVDLYKDIYGIIKSADKDAIEDFDEAVADGFDDFFKDASDTFGDDYKMTYEIRDAERLDDGDIKDIEDAYEDLFDLIDDNIDYEDEDFYEELAEGLEDDADISLSDSQIRKLQKAVESFMGSLEDFKIQDAYEVKIRLEIEGEDDDYKETLTFYIIKVNGDWFIDPNSLMEGLGGGSMEGTLSSILYYL